MDEETFKERVKRLKEIDKVVKGLDPAIRAPAFHVLAECVGLAGASGAGRQTHPERRGDGRPARQHSGAPNRLFTEFEHTKPSENLWLIVAFLYASYGREEFTGDEVRAIAKDEGLNIPDRFNANLVQRKHKNKLVCGSVRNSVYRLNAHGARWIEETYSVKAGTQKKPVQADE